MKKEDLIGMIARTDCQMYDRGPIIDIFKDEDGDLMITIDDPYEGHETNPINEMIIEWPYANIWEFDYGNSNYEDLDVIRHDTFICDAKFNEDIVYEMLKVAYWDDRYRYMKISNLKIKSSLTHDIPMRKLTNKYNISNIKPNNSELL